VLRCDGDNGGTFLLAKLIEGHAVQFSHQEPNVGDGMIPYTAVRYALGRWTMHPKSRPAGCRSSTPRPRIIHLYVVIAARIYLFMRNRKELRQIAAHLKGVQ
jgi:hypothetical protein